MLRVINYEFYNVLSHITLHYSHDSHAVIQAEV
jgi:hypothetical protein